jgi:hypothetical protein
VGWVSIGFQLIVILLFRKLKRSIGQFEQVKTETVQKLAGILKCIIKVISLDVYGI